MRIFSRARNIWLCGLLAGVAAMSFSQPQNPLPAVTSAAVEPAVSPISASVPAKEMFQYEVEWRLVRAGTARLSFTPFAHDHSWQANLQLESTGLVSKLYKVRDDYTAQLDSRLCSTSLLFNAQEGKRRRETKVTFDGQKSKASYLERDLVKNNVALAKEIDTAPCVTDVIGAILKIRTLKLEPGQTTQLPMSDGKKFVQLRVEAQERETVKTKLGPQKTIRYEAFLFNDVLYSKKGRAFIWLTDDAARTPVQIRVRLHLLIGTITFQLEKVERS